MITKAFDSDGNNVRASSVEAPYRDRVAHQRGVIVHART